VVSAFKKGVEMPECHKCKKEFKSDVSLMQHMKSSKCAGTVGVKRGVKSWEGYRQQKSSPCQELVILLS